MDLRTLNIGARLGGGFALILLALAGVIAGLLLSQAADRRDMLAVMASSAEREAQANVMQKRLLGSAVAVRSMGLQTEVEGVQKAEAEAKAERAAYLAAQQKLASFGLSSEEGAVLAKLVDVDRQMEQHFKEAVDLAGTFNAEQAAAVITKKIDPLLVQATAGLDAFAKLQQQHASEAATQAQVRAQRVQQAAVGAALAVILLSAGLAWRLTISITRPLQTAEQTAARVAAGDLDFQVPLAGRDEAARLLAALNEMRLSLARVVAGVRHNAESVATAATEIAQGNNDLSGRTEQQASALQQTAASMEELGTAVRHNADNAVQANQLAQGASDVATRGGEMVGRVVSTMKGINDSSRQIADIIGVIDGIAFQTNILALNAAVEAARAGEQGRGFAVVATEVRSLAQRSADAAKQIKTLIGTSVDRVEQGTALVDEAGTTMTEIVNAIRRVSDIVGEISSASHEQSAGVSQVGQAVTQMDQATQQNAALVEESAAAAESLRQQAHHLVQTVAVFRIGQGQPA